MPTFKTKLTNKYVSQVAPVVTLDGMHRAICQSFKKEQETQPELKERCDTLKKQLKETVVMEEQFRLREELRVIEQKIKTIKKKETNYLLNNVPYIFEYFENKKNLSKLPTGNSTVLANFFQGCKDKKSEASNYEKQIVQKYFANMDSSYINLANYAVQPRCSSKDCKGEMIPLEHEGVMMCNVCSVSMSYLVENEKSNYKDPPKEACFYAYKRINHFREILAQFQAKETTQIPDAVLENIKQQVVKERITLEQLTNKRTKDILKKLGYNKYYEHISFIKDKLGIKPPIMNVELETILCSLFMDIQAPYAKCCPDDRVNFLNYYYTVYKLCELLDQNQFLPYFPMLKDRAKRIEQDEIWQKICAELDWAYIPTV